MGDVHHAIGLTMHQPLGNLLELHQRGERWDVKQILWAYARAPAQVLAAGPKARLHVAMSGTLLKQFEDPAIAETFAGTVNIEEILTAYRSATGIELLGSGLYHPVYPLTPEADWPAHTQWWQGLAKKILHRDWFPGFCPPEIGICQEMIPHLVDAGYRYVVVDGIYIKPRRELQWHEQRFQPFWCSHGGKRLVVIPIDRELSNAQASGTEPWWFEAELAARTKWCDFPSLVTTWSDGENGGWFRMPEWQYAFWGVFYRPLMEKHAAGELSFTPTSINEFLDKHEPREEVDLHRGAWNTDHHWGGDFTQWTGSLLQKRGFDELRNASAYYHRSKRHWESVKERMSEPEAAKELLHQAYDRLLLAETSCNFYWGSKRVHRAFDDVEQCYFLLDQARRMMPEPPPEDSVEARPAVPIIAAPTTAASAGTVDVAASSDTAD